MKAERGLDTKQILNIFLSKTFEFFLILSQAWRLSYGALSEK